MNSEDLRRIETPLIDFSEDKEFTLPARFPVDEETEPLFKGNMVSKPMAVLKEGTYRKVVQQGMKLKLAKFTYSKTDLEKMVANAERDVPLNFDHFRGGPNDVGWVRTKSGKFYVDKLEDGKHALFAQIEARPQTVNSIEDGTYRDFSPEVRPYETRFVGLALTNYPVMQGLHQFSELEEDEPTETDFTEDNPMTDTEREALVAQLRDEVTSEFSEKISTLEATLEEERAARIKAESTAKLNQFTLEFSEKIRNLVGSKIAPSARDALLNLYIFAAQNDGETLSYSEGEETKEVSPVQLLDVVLNAIPENKMFEQVADDSTEEVAAEETFSDTAGDGFSEEEMKALRERVQISLEEQS